MQNSSHGGGAAMAFTCGLALNQQRLRPERGAQSPRECERGWGPASIEI